MNRGLLLGFCGAMGLVLLVIVAGGLLFPRSKMIAKKPDKIVEANLVAPEDEKKTEEATEEEIKQAAPVAMPDRILTAAPQLDTSAPATEAPPLSLGDLESLLNPGGASGFGSGGGGLGVSRGIGGGAGGGDGEDPFAASELDQPPRPLNQSPPQYPTALARQKMEGNVVVMFVIDAQGRVGRVQIESSSGPEFTQAVVDAVRKWTYEPGVRDGQPVPARIRRTINFRPGA